MLFRSSGHGFNDICKKFDILLQRFLSSVSCGPQFESRAWFSYYSCWSKWLDCTLLANGCAPNLMQVLRNHAVPHLESFHLTPFNNQRTTDYSPLDFFFNGTAPKLTSLRFDIHFSALFYSTSPLFAWWMDLHSQIEILHGRNA